MTLNWALYILYTCIAYHLRSHQYGKLSLTYLLGELHALNLSWTELYFRLDYCQNK